MPAATVVVYLDPGQQDLVVPHVHGLLTTSGRLQVGRNEESDGSVSWVRLQLDPEAKRGIDGVGKTGYLHRLQPRHRAR